MMSFNLKLEYCGIPKKYMIINCEKAEEGEHCIVGFANTQKEGEILISKLEGENNVKINN